MPSLLLSVIGVSSVPLPRSRCVCGKVLDAVHLHACPRNRRRGVLNRHDKVKMRLAYIARTAGLDVEVEPSCGGFSTYAKALIRSIASHAADHHPLFDAPSMAGRLPR